MQKLAGCVLIRVALGSFLSPLVFVIEALWHGHQSFSIFYDSNMIQNSKETQWGNVCEEVTICEPGNFEDLKMDVGMDVGIVPPLPMTGDTLHLLATDGQMTSGLSTRFSYGQSGR